MKNWTITGLVLLEVHPPPKHGSWLDIRNTGVRYARRAGGQARQLHDERGAGSPTHP